MFKEKILYTKISDFRADKYKIKTEIYRNRLGILRVRKSPLMQDGWPHLRKMGKTEKLLAKEYKQHGVHVVKCIQKRDCVIFPYVIGDNLGEIFSLYLSMDNLRLIHELLDLYIDRITHLLGKQTEFEQNKGFNEIFGNMTFERPQKAVDNPNIDLIFSNIVVKNGMWSVVDYEWVFDFPIPINYILCRSIYLVLHENNRTDLAEELIIDKLGISKQEYEIYQKMEHQLQLWILGKK